MDVTIPHNYTPRNYQLPLLEALDSGIKRAFCLWHRRSGKDKSLISLIAKKTVEKVGIYYYFFPTYAQGKKILWDGIDRDGFAFMDHFPKEIIKNKNSQEMKLEIVNGSIFQIVGTDKYDSVRGTNPIGCVFSEFAFQNPMAWEVVRPILLENGGWAVFNTTPNGKNHSYDLDIMARDNPKWFSQVLTANDTKRPDGSPVITEEMIQEERLSGMSEEMIQQEYYCSYDIGVLGSYYSDEMTKANAEDRVTKLPFYNDKEIDMAFDLGINDMFTIWFYQKNGQMVNFINYYEANNKKLDYYFAYIKEYIEGMKGKTGTIYLPHDAKKRELITGRTIEDDFKKEFGKHKVKTVEIGEIRMGIQAVRKVLPRCLFDAEGCKQGLRCLENYHREYDQVKKVFINVPYHDWASHGADSFRCFAMSYKEPIIRPEYKPDESFDRFSII